MTGTEGDKILPRNPTTPTFMDIFRVIPYAVLDPHEPVHLAFIAYTDKMSVQGLTYKGIRTFFDLVHLFSCSHYL